MWREIPDELYFGIDTYSSLLGKRRQRRRLQRRRRPTDKMSPARFIPPIRRPPDPSKQLAIDNFYPVVKSQVGLTLSRPDTWYMAQVFTL